MNKRVLIMALVFFPFIRINGLHRIIDNSQYAYDVISVVLLTYALLLILTDKRKCLDGFLVLMVVFFSVIVLSTVIHSGDYLGCIRVSTTILGLVCYISIFSYNKMYSKYICEALLLVHETIIYLNAATVLNYPNGMYLAHGTFGSSNNWLMGYDNHWFIFYYAAYYLGFLQYILKRNKVRFLTLIIVLHATALYTLSGVLVGGLLVMDIIYFFKIYETKIFNLKTTLIVSMVISIILVFFSSIDIINQLLYNYLDKGNSFQGRLQFWNRAIEIIKSNPIVGYGRLATLDAQNYYGLVSGVNSHNMWFEILIEGGIIAMIFFISMYLLVVKKTKSVSDSTIFKVSIVPIFTIMIMMSVDSIMETRGVMLFGILCVLYNLDRMFSAEELNNKNHLNHVVQKRRRL